MKTIIAGLLREQISSVKMDLAGRRKDMNRRKGSRR